jgi:hypothetical protein
MAVVWGVMTVAAARGGYWVLLPLPGGATVAVVIVAVHSFRSTTIVSDSGVQPFGRRSQVLPWQEIDAFIVIPGARNDATVFLLRTGGRRPFELDALNRIKSDAQAIAKKLNAIAQARHREDAVMGTSVGQRCYVRATAETWETNGPFLGFTEARLPQANGTVVTIYGKDDGIGWHRRKSRDIPSDAFLPAEVIAVPDNTASLTVRILHAQDPRGRTDFTVSWTMVTTAPGG